MATMDHTTSKVVVRNSASQSGYAATCKQLATALIDHNYTHKISENKQGGSKTSSHCEHVIVYVFVDRRLATGNVDDATDISKSCPIKFKFTFNCQEFNQSQRSLAWQCMLNVLSDDDLKGDMCTSMTAAMLSEFSKRRLSWVKNWHRLSRTISVLDDHAEVKGLRENIQNIDSYQIDETIVVEIIPMSVPVSHEALREFNQALLKMPQEKEIGHISRVIDEYDVTSEYQGTKQDDWMNDDMTKKMGSYAQNLLLESSETLSPIGEDDMDEDNAMLTESMPCCDLDSSDMELVVLPESSLVIEDALNAKCNTDNESVEETLSSQENDLKKTLDDRANIDTKVSDQSVPCAVVTRQREIARKTNQANQSKKACLRSSKLNGIFPNRKPKALSVTTNETNKVRANAPKYMEINARKNNTQTTLQTKTVTQQVFVPQNANSSASVHAMPVLTLPCVLLQDCLKKNSDSGQQADLMHQNSLSKAGGSKMRIILPKGITLNAFLQKPCKNDNSRQANLATQKKRTPSINYKIVKTEHIDTDITGNRMRIQPEPAKMKRKKKVQKNSSGFSILQGGTKGRKSSKVKTKSKFFSLSKKRIDSLRQYYTGIEQEGRKDTYGQSLACMNTINMVDLVNVTNPQEKFLSHLGLVTSVQLKAAISKSSEGRQTRKRQKKIPSRFDLYDL